MRIELDITDARIQAVTVTDWSDPDSIEIVGYDYGIAPEDADDDTLDSDEHGLRRYVSDGAVSRPADTNPS